MSRFCPFQRSKTDSQILSQQGHDVGGIDNYIKSLVEDSEMLVYYSPGSQIADSWAAQVWDTL